MSIIEKMSKIVNDGDVAAGEKLIHDDYQFLMHSSGNKLGKQDLLKWLGMKDVKLEKVPDFKLSSVFFIFSSSRSCVAFSTNETTSPIPKILIAILSG